MQYKLSHLLSRSCNDWERLLQQRVSTTTLHVCLLNAHALAECSCLMSFFPSVSGCQGAYGTIGNNSCNGESACPWFDDMTIGNGSCGCAQCCKCLQDRYDETSTFLQIPDGSCNAIAPDAGSIDFVNAGSGPYQYCCSVDDLE